MADRFEKEVEQDGFPFFPTPAGAIVHKAIIVLLIEAVMSKLGVDLQTKDGRRAYGGHAFRVGGAQHLVRVGLGFRIILLLARWGSEIIMGYVRNAPLENLTSDYLSARASGGSTSGTSKMALNERDLKKVVELQAKYEEQEKIIEDLRARLDDIQVTVEEPKYVVSVNLAWHKSRPTEGVPAAMWKTLCGWPYHASVFTRERHVPDDVLTSSLCDRCLNTEVNARRENERRRAA